MKLKLSDEVKFVKGVGPKWAERLCKLEIQTGLKPNLDEHFS